MERFTSKDIFVSAFLLSKGNDFPEIELDERTDKVVFSFIKTDKLLQDFYEFKKDEFMQLLASNTFYLKKKMWEYKDAQKLG